MLDLSICIVNWNVEALLKACLGSIFKETKGISFEVIVVDNHSSDNSVNMIKTDFPQVKLIENKDNAGFTKANNQAIKQSQGRYIMLLNPDTEIIDNALDKMIKFFGTRPDCGALGCKLLNTDGSLQRSCKTFPSLDVILYNSLFLDSLFPKSRLFGKYFMTWWDFNDVREVDQPMGSALMIRKDVLDKAGLFDENIFIWFDEVDLCYRIKKAGYKIYFTPEARIKHHLSRSFKQWTSFPQIMRGTFLWRQSRNYFFRKHKGILSVAALWLIDLVQIALILAILYALMFCVTRLTVLVRSI
jgi:hypothetical protein